MVKRMKISGILTLFVVFIVIALIAHDAITSQPKQTAARDTMRVIVHQRDTVHDIITVREKARQHWDTIVRNVSDTQVVIQRDTTTITVTVPVEVIQRDRSKDSLLSILYVDRRLDSLWHIQDAKLPHKPESPWGIGATCGVDPFNTNGPRCTFGLTYRAKIRLPFLR